MANVSIQSPEPPVDLLPSHIAAVKNDVEKLAKLVEEGEPLEDPNTKETPLHAAAKMGSLDSLRWLLRNNTVSPEARSSSGYTAAHWAAVYGHFDCLKLLLTNDPTKGKELASIGDESGLTVLSLATLQGDKTMVSWLLDNFPETAHIANSNGDQIVHFAAAEGHLDILKVLVGKFGKEIASLKDSRSTTPVFFAAQQGKLDILTYLVDELGQDPVATDKDGLITLHAATQSEMTSTVKWLVGKMGPKYILEKTIDGATPLHMAAASGNTEILKFLLDNLEDKKDVNVTDNINATPAHDAAEYGKIKTMLLLLKHGADINITDTENKTPYQLAVEQNHTSVAAMLADYRDNGPSALQAYEKKRARPSRDEKGPRTSRQEAEELSTAIEKSSEALDNFKEKQLKRQESLSKMNDIGIEEDTKDKKQQQQKNRSKHQEMSPQGTDEEGDIEHELGPKGDIYALPIKKGQGRPQRVKGGRSHQNSDVEDFMSETMSHRSYNAAHRPYHYRGGSYDEEPPYAIVNHDTASNYSRPSRVKHYRDTDSELSGLTGRSDYLYDGRGHGFYPPGYNPMYPPSLPPPRGKKGKRPGSASSKGSHPSASQYRGHPPMSVASSQYGGYNQHGYPQMYPMYQMYPAGYHGGGMMAMSPQQQQAMMRGYTPQGVPVYMGAHPQMQRLMQQQQQSRRKSLADKKKTKRAAAESKPSPRKPQPDQDIGYGPALEATDSGHIMDTKYEDDFHPPAPPISTAMGGKMEAASEVLKFDSNFLMARPGESNEIRHHAGTALNPVKAKPKPYDGRYDKYIMTDSEEEYEPDEYHKVGFAAEVACILAIGCVAGLKGLSKMRRGKPSLPPPKPAAADKPSLSTAWDVSYTDADPTPKKKKGKRSRRNSISEIDASITQGMSPEAFAGHEDAERSTWAKSSKKQGKEEVKKKKSDPQEPQSELLTSELKKQSHQSVSKALGEKLLYDTIGARHSSMLNIASSGMGSRMSLASSADEMNDDDDFGDAISMVQGLPSGAGKRKHLTPDPASVDIEANDTERLLSENKHKRKKSKKERKKKKDKAKKESGDKEGAEVIENAAALSGENIVTSIGSEDEVDGASKDDQNEKEMKKEKREKEKRERETREREREEERERKERERQEREEREREKKEKEAREKEQREQERREKEQERKDKEQRERERKAAEKSEREQRERERKEREREQKEKEKRDKEQREKEKREAKEREKREKEQKERELKEKAKREKEEKRERERQEKEQREKEKREQRERAARERAASSTPARPTPPPPNANLKQHTTAETETSKVVESPKEASRAKPASKTTPPNQVRAELEAEDEAREVENKVYMFDTESEESEEEGGGADISLVTGVGVGSRQHKSVTTVDPDVDEIEMSMKNIAADLNSFLEDPFPPVAPGKNVMKKTAPPPPKPTQPSNPKPIAEDDAKSAPNVPSGGQEMAGESREEGKMKQQHAEFEDEEEGGMQFGFGDDISAMAEEMHNFYQEEDLYTYMEGSTPSLDQASYSGIPGEDEGEKLVLVTKDELEHKLAGLQTSDQADMSSQFDGLGGGGGRSMHSIGIGEGVTMSEAGVQGSLLETHSIGTQDAGYSSSFEQNVLATLKALSDKMLQMKSNPTVTQQEINQQQQVQNEMIQSMLNMSLNDPAVMKNLLAMIQQQVGTTESRRTSRRSSTAFEELQFKLLQAQEQQRQQTMEQFQSQTHFQEAMKKQLEEQAKIQMMGIQTNFELYAKKMQEQLAEQQKRWDEEMRKREEKKRKKSRDKRHKKNRKQRPSTADSSESSLSSESDEGLMLGSSKPSRPKSSKYPAIKTMQAKILTQNLLEEDDMKTDSQVSIAKIQKKQQARGKLVRQDTSMKFDNARDAMRRFESRVESHGINAVGEEDEEEEEDDDDMMVPQIHPITLTKRAEIKVQSGTGYTPARPEPPPSSGSAAGKVGRIRRIDEMDQQQEDSHQTEGAGNELTTALKKRLKK